MKNISGQVKCHFHNKKCNLKNKLLSNFCFDSFTILFKLNKRMNERVLLEKKILVTRAPREGVHRLSI